jgi:hypothetical protein
LQCTSATNGSAMPMLRAKADHTWKDIDDA